MKKILSGNQIKLIAILSMFVDHLTWTIVPGYENKSWYIVALHLFGRLAAPLMWFMIVEGYEHTRDLKKYITRLGIFAVISHFAYNFCFGIPFIPFKEAVFNQTSVIWALFLAVIALYINDDERRSFELSGIQKLLITTVLCLLAFPSDWSSFPVLCALNIRKNKGNLPKQVFGMLPYITFYVYVWVTQIDVVYGLLQYGIVLVFPIMSLYNGTRGRKEYSSFMKWFFYAFYVGHLILLGIARILIHGNISTIVGA